MTEIRKADIGKCAKQIASTAIHLAVITSLFTTEGVLAGNAVESDHLHIGVELMDMRRPPEVIRTFPVVIEGRTYSVKILAPHHREEKYEPMQTHPSNESPWQRYTRREHERFAR